MTPGIDSIARNGITFRAGYVSASVCSPSRAGLLTGRYQQRFGHEYNLPGMPDDRLTEEDRSILGISPGVLRISVGLEHTDDLKEDLERALAAA